MVWDLVLGFVLVFVGTYIGATVTFRGFFGRESYDPRTGEKDGDGGDSSEVE